ncbi:hypothetical protein RQP46_001720 [Phenoliferia psychrophenolica]
MWQRQPAQTGSNGGALGTTRRWGGDDRSGGAPQGQGGPPPQQQGGYDSRDSRGPPPQQHGGGGGGYEDRGRSDSRGGGGGGGYGGGYDQRDSRDSRGPPPQDRDQRGGGGYDDRRGAPPSQAPVRSGSAWDQPAPQSSYGNLPPPPPPPASGERVRKSRWGNERVEPGGMPTAITGGVDGKDLESYAVQLRLDEIARSLRTGLVVPPDGSRSPSPPPTYDGHGRRTNTREVRYRKKLEDERMRLVDRQMKNDPNFKPPTEYLMAKRGNNGRPTDKVYIPVKEFPEINFFGLLVGPRGNSLKTMERESGAKISIRGKGSVKEGKGRPGGGFEDDQNEELHCLITADTEEKVQRCVKLINGVIEIAASVPEGQNDHKRNQLRELAQLNGTLRDDENQVCQNCGGIGHRKYDCPEQKNWTAGIICRVCGGAGHMARDCTQGRGGPPGQFGGPPGPGGVAPDPARAQQFDSEYASLMAELGESSAAPPIAGAPGAPAAPQGGAPWGAPGGNMPGPPLDENGEKIPPWRIPSNWNPPQPVNNFQRGPPQPQPQHAAYTGQSQGYSSFPSMQGQYGQQSQAPGYPGAQAQAPYGGGYQQQQPQQQQNQWGR